MLATNVQFVNISKALEVITIFAMFAVLILIRSKMGVGYANLAFLTDMPPTVRKNR